MDETSRRLVDDVYAAFAAYERPASFLACGCCWWNGQEVASSGWNGTERPIVRVTSPGGDRALNELTEAELAELFVDIALTGGDLALYKHYLPRALEILADGGWNDWPDDELIIRRLTHMADEEDNLSRWPESERRPVEALIDHLVTDERRSTWGDPTSW